jgi:hypothetical protein
MIPAATLIMWNGTTTARREASTYQKVSLSMAAQTFCISPLSRSAFSSKAAAQRRTRHAIDDQGPDGGGDRGRYTAHPRPEQIAGGDGHEEDAGHHAGRQGGEHGHQDQQAEDVVVGGEGAELAP